MGIKSIVVVHDASKEVNWVAIGEFLRNFSLMAGDELILLGVVHQFNYSTTTSTFLGALKLLGQGNKVDQKLEEEELVKRMEEYNKSLEMFVLLKECKAQKVKFHIEVQAGNSRKVVAVIAIKRLEATWIILDREMKKEKRYFMEKLSCRLSIMKSNNTIKDVRGPLRLPENTKVMTLSRNAFSYDEMIPGDDDSSEELPRPQKISRTRTSSKEQCAVFRKAPFVLRENSMKRSSSTDLMVSSSSLRNPSSSSISSHSEATTADNSPSHDSNDQKQKHQIVQVDKEKEEICNDLYLYGLISKKLNVPFDFSYKELEEATKGFSKENFLSEGGFGFVYKGVLKNGLRVAVKQHKDMSLQGHKKFKSEVEVISKARHTNLVMLLGSCSAVTQKLLVYECVCNGSLDQFLSGDLRLPLNWERRIKIALGAARGLKYLHKHNIIHRAIRPSNILITHDHESLLGDFGLAKAGCDESQNSCSNHVVGTLGYMAPEYAANGKFSAKTDVYAFGVVLLQLITGLKTTDKYPEDKSLVEWAMPLLEQRNYPRLIDKRIMDSHDFHQLFWMVELAGKCLEKDPNKRHNMEWVVKTLSNIMEGNVNTSIDFNTKGSNEDDRILGTVTTSSCSTDNTCSSKRKTIPLKHKGPSPNKSKLLYEEMIH
ncbi:unnamed protein product [Withania somnifera]